MNNVASTLGGANSMAMDQLSAMIGWEEGALNQQETIQLFQGLIDSGLVWSLQGCYGRTAAALIQAGYCHG